MINTRTSSSWKTPNYTVTKILQHAEVLNNNQPFPQRGRALTATRKRSDDTPPVRDNNIIIAHQRNTSRTRQNSASHKFTEQVEIPKNIVGYVIGAKGKRINEMKSRTKCEIRIRSETGICEISGPREGVIAAKCEIEEVVQQNKEKLIEEIFLILTELKIDEKLHEKLIDTLLKQGFEGYEELVCRIIRSPRDKRLYESLKDIDNFA